MKSEKEVVDISLQVASLGFPENTKTKLSLLTGAVFSACSGHNIDFWRLGEEHRLEHGYSMSDSMKLVLPAPF